jgi:hypothetical protein
VAGRAVRGKAALELMRRQLRQRGDVQKARACGEGAVTGGGAGGRGAGDEGQDAELAEKELLALKMAALLLEEEERASLEMGVPEGGGGGRGGRGGRRGGGRAARSWNAGDAVGGRKRR